MFHSCAKIFLTFLITISLPFCILILTPIYFLRFILAKSVKFLNPSLGKILTTKSTCVGVDEIYTKPQWTLLLVIVLKGSPSLDGIQRRFMRNVIQAQSSQGNFYKPELQQYVTSWLGFLFWKWDKEFKIENHIYQYQGEFASQPMTEENVFNIGQSLIYKPYATYRSPWELIFIEDIKVNDPTIENEQHSVVFLRAHHVLADGFSLLKLLIMDVCAVKQLPIAQPNPNHSQNRKPMIQKISRYFGPFYMLFRGPFDIATAILDVMAYNKNDWHVSENKLKRTLNSAISNDISVQTVKDIKNLCNCSFASVLLAAYTGAMRKFMTEAEYSIPDNILCAIALPVPNHPKYKLRNHATGVLVRLPTGLVKPLDRLKAVQANQQKLRSSTLPVTIFYAMTLIGGLFACMTRMVTKNSVTTVVGSIFPGPSHGMGTDRFPARQISYGGGLTRGNTGLGFSALSYNSKVSVIVGIDNGIVDSSKVPASKLLEYMLQELELIKDTAASTFTVQV